MSKFSIIYQFTVISNCYLLQFDAGGRQKVRGIWSQTRQEGATGDHLEMRKYTKTLSAIGFPCVNSVLCVPRPALGHFHFRPGHLIFSTGLELSHKPPR